MKKNLGFGLMLLGISIAFIACCIPHTPISIHVFGVVLLAIGLTLTVFTYMTAKKRIIKLSPLSEQIQIIAVPLFQNFYPIQNNYGVDYGCLWYHWKLLPDTLTQDFNNSLSDDWFCTAQSGTKLSEAPASVAYRNIQENFSIQLPTDLMNELISCYQQMQRVWTNLQAWAPNKKDDGLFKVFTDSVGTYYDMVSKFYNDYCREIDPTLCNQSYQFESCGKFCCFGTLPCCSPTSGNCPANTCSPGSCYGDPSCGCAAINPDICNHNQCNCDR